MEFADDQGSRGKVHFRDDHPQALYVESEITRITPRLIKERLGKSRSRLTTHKHMKDFALSIARSEA